MLISAADPSILILHFREELRYLHSQDYHSSHLHHPSAAYQQIQEVVEHAYHSPVWTVDPPSSVEGA